MEGRSDPTWLDNFAAYGGITARNLIPRYESIHDFLGVEPDAIPMLPFNTSWREQLPAFSYQATADRVKLEALSLACGLRNKPPPNSTLGASMTKERGASGDEHRGISSAEFPRDDTRSSSKVHRPSFSSCISQDDAEDEATRAIQDSGGSTTVEVESATTDSSERSITCAQNGLRDERFADDVHDNLVASRGTESPDVDPTIGTSFSLSPVSDCDAVPLSEVSTDVIRHLPEELSRQEEFSRSASSENVPHGRSREGSSREEWTCSREAWWEFPLSVYERQVRYLENVPPFTRLLCMKNVKAAHRPESRSPWLEGRSDDIYEEMGILDPSRSYIAFWLGFGNYNTVLFSSEVVDRARLDSMLASDCLNRRLKLLLHPVRVSLPFPAKAAREAETVGAFFGTKGTSIRRFRTRCGAEVTSVQVDLFSKWLLKVAMTKVGLRENNCLEAILVDWLPENPAILSAGRIHATEGFIRDFYAA